MIGSTLNHYEILRKLGSGGMGDVYVARDKKLGREVALKVLPAELAANPEARNRFAREAKSLAALNHPGIVTLFSIEDADGLHFMTMEVVHGKTLAELIHKGGLTLEELFDIAIPLADAISAAHQQGITHRDLKPQNVMVTDEGSVKVLDFGLAKLHEEIPGKAMTQLGGTVATEEGRILGTVSYMSPEQAQGIEVDPRSDIFSMGVLLYEMATGERPFKGDTGVSILSSILKDTPAPVTEINRRLPRHLGRIVKHCLQKDPERRYQTALDVRNDLEDLREEVDSGELHAPAAEPKPTRTGNRVVLAAGAVVLLAAAFIAVKLFDKGDATEGSGEPVQIRLTKLTSQPGRKMFPTLSPDGKTVAYAWREGDKFDIYVLRVGGGNPINLTRDEADNNQPAFSPDGEHIAFWSDRGGGGLFVMGATGESVRRLTDFGYNPAWSPNGRKIVFASDSGEHGSLDSDLWTVDVASGTTCHLFEGVALEPRWSPNGHRIAYWGLHAGGQRDVWTIPADGGEPVPVTNAESTDMHPTWSPDGRHLYFFSDRGGWRNLWRTRIDELTGEPLGEPESITKGGSASRGQASFSGDGRHIAFVEQITDRHIWRVPIDPDNTRQDADAKAERVTTGSAETFSGELSPNGEWFAFSRRSPHPDIYVSRADGTERRQLTDDAHKDHHPRWSPDGKRLAWYSERSGNYEIWVIDADGRGMRRITESAKGVTGPVWSPDGSKILYSDNRQTFICDASRPLGEGTVDSLPRFGERKVDFSSWSSDGRRLAGQSWSGDEQPILVLFSLDTREYEELPARGVEPNWLSDGRRLVFLQDNKRLMLLDVETKEQRALAQLPESDKISVLRLTKDERWLYFQRFKAASDIWLATLE